MTGPRRRPTVLLVDRDPGLLLWLGQIFTEAGYQAIPAPDCESAVSTVRELGLPIAVVVMNPKLVEAPGLIKALRVLWPGFRVVALTDKEGADSRAIGADATLRRPSRGEPVSHQDWLERVRRMMRQLRAPDTGTDR